MIRLELQGLSVTLHRLRESALSLQSVSKEKPDFGIMAVTLEDLLVKPLCLGKLARLVQFLGLFKDAGHGAHGNMKRRSRNHEITKARNSQFPLSFSSS